MCVPGCCVPWTAEHLTPMLSSASGHVYEMLLSGNHAEYALRMLLCQMRHRTKLAREYSEDTGEKINEIHVFIRCWAHPSPISLAGFWRILCLQSHNPLCIMQICDCCASVPYFKPALCRSIIYSISFIRKCHFVLFLPGRIFWVWIIEFISNTFSG